MAGWTWWVSELGDGGLGFGGGEGLQLGRLEGASE